MKEKKKLEDNHTDEPFISFTIPEPDESGKKDIEKVALLIRQRHRAIFLMKQLGISERVIDLYRKKGHIPHYLNGMYIGSAELHEKLRDKITSYEQRSGCMVYAVCKDYLYGCRFISLLFVSPYEEDWQWDITTHGISTASMPMCITLTQKI